jgi:uncharacterized repeat protein (TIGR01451 family)
LRLKHLGKHQHCRGDRTYLGSKKKPTAKLPRLFKFLTTVIISFIFTLVFSGISLWQSAPALAAPILTIQPISWNIVGLDSNNVNVGPNTYMVGARVCNVGDTAATNVTATFVRDGAINSLLNLQGSSTLTLASLPAGTTSQPPGNTGATPNNCTDFYYNIVITRNSAAYNTSQMYHIEASATGVGTISTPLNREIYVEKLVSQNRNSVLSITGPSTVTVGQTYQYTVQGSTATNGYEQLVFSPNFPNILFQVLASNSTYDAPAGTRNNAIYADACGWDPIIGPTPPQGTYRSCKGPYNYPGGKAGGNVTTVYTVKVLSAGSATITNLIYDFSGSSYHYNSDLGTGVNAITITAVNPSTNADLQIIKSHTGNFALNQNSNYTLTVSNVGQTASSGTITVTDTLPTGLTYVSASGTAIGSNNWSCSATGQTVTCTNAGSLAANASSTITLTVQPTATGTITNQATVTNTSDTNNVNNSSSDPTIINDLVDLSITKTDGLTTINPSGSITYTITVKNLSTSNLVSNAPVTDDVPTAITNVSWTCSASGSNSCGAASGTGNSISTTVTLAKNGGTATFTVKGTVSDTATGTLSNTANVSAPSGISDPTPSNNTATDTTNVNAPDLTISKTHNTNISYNQNGVFSLTVKNVGFATTSGTITVTDTLPTTLTYISAAGNNNTNWNCSFNSINRNVTCTSITGFTLAASASSSINLTVKRTTQDNISNTATVSNTSDKNSNNNSSTDVLPATTRLRLVKRITRINTIAKTGYIDNPSDANDDSTLMWPTPLSTYLQGVINGGNVKPGDLIEYTVYFLSDGGTPAQNVTLCDLVPFNSTFSSTTFNTNSGIAMALSSSNLPTAPTNYFTNIADTDGGQLYTAGTTLPAACASNTNPNGAVVVKVVTGTTTVPNATASGTPSNSYGFIRFVAKIN